MSKSDDAKTEFYEFLRTKFTAQELLDWKLSDKIQEDVQRLLDKNNAGTISGLELQELEAHADFNHCFTFMKLQPLFELKDD